MESKAISKNTKIEFLRFLYAMIIVFFHGSSVNGHPNSIFPSGYVATEFFFILSGFFLAKSAYSKGDSPPQLVSELYHELKKRYVSTWIRFLPSFLILFFLAHFADFYFFVRHQGGLRSILSGLLSSVFELFFLCMAGTYNRISLYDPPVWYFSSILIAIVVLYPLMRKYRNTYYGFIAPFLIIGSYSYLFRTYASLQTIGHILPFGYTGTLRAVSGMALGSLLFYFAAKKTTHIGRETPRHVKPLLYTVLEALGILLTLILMHSRQSGITDYAVVILFAAVVYLAFTKETYWDILTGNRFICFLGELSVYIFLSHWIVISILVNWGIQVSQFSALGYTCLLAVGSVLVALCNRCLVVFGMKWYSKYFSQL